jgi:hypothetical protein
MKRFSRKERVLLAIAPITAPVGLMISRIDTLGTPDLRDAVSGVVMGVGIGMSLAVLIKHKLSGGG